MVNGNVNANDRVCLGVIVGAQGVRGEVRIKPFTAEPGDVGAYGPVSDKGAARVFDLKIRGQAKGVVIAALKGVVDRNAAEALKGIELYVDRARLPATDDEDTFYHADLVGLAAVDENDKPVGQVAAVFDHGAGDVLDIRLVDGKSITVPFTKAVVPVVDLAAKRIVVMMPEGLLDDGTKPVGDEG